MSLEDKERLEKELKEKVLKNMNGLEDLVDFFTTQLGNFAYRYIESESTGESSPSWEDDKTLAVQLKEHTLANALKTENAVTRAGLIDLAKSFHKKDNPCVSYQLGVRIFEVNNQGGGDFEAFAETNWDFPNFSNLDKCNSKAVKVSFEDSLELRNNFALSLEEVCTVF